LVIISPASIFAGNQFIAVGYNGQFTRIDTSIGEIPPTRNDLPYSLQEIAKSPKGIYYTINYFDSPSGLWTIDPFTGGTKYLYRPNIVYPVRGMAFSPSGKLYVTENSTSFYLGVLDITTGSYSRLGQMSGDNIQADGLCFSPNGQLYGTVGGMLYTINTGNGRMYRVGNGQFLQSSFALAFTPNGSLYATGYDYGSTYPDYKYAFVQVDPLTGSRIGEPIQLSGADRGLAYVIPEPTTLLLLGLGAAIMRKRR
jgi:WD40 repeat protein